MRRLLVVPVTISSLLSFLVVCNGCIQVQVFLPILLLADLTGAFQIARTDLSCGLNCGLNCQSSYTSSPISTMGIHRNGQTQVFGRCNEGQGRTSARTSARIRTELHSKSNKKDTESTTTSWQTKIIETVTNNPKQSLLFSLSQTIAGAALGPFLDTYHSIFGVLQYDYPFTLQLWSPNEIPALVTTWWVPYLFGLAGFIIGWLYILLDSVFNDDNNMMNDNNINNNTKGTPMGYSPPIILIGISFFTFQYWLSGILSYYNIDRTIIFSIMTICAYYGYTKLDNTKSGLITSLATAIGGPLIEVGLISFLTDSVGGYHYTDSGETGFFPLWIVPVYFLGGPANGNLARGVWDALERTTTDGGTGVSTNTNTGPKGCTVCNDSRAVPCPNCDGVGYYITYNQEVKCNCCNGRGLVICRECFHLYDEDPNDIEAIREKMSRLPD